MPEGNDMAAIAKRTTIDLSLDIQAAFEWGVFEGIREIFQNALDAQDLGYELVWDYNPKTQTLKISNEGVVIGRETLKIGHSTKRGVDGQRGKYGEGFKLGWAALIRNGKQIWAKSGDERWVPRVGRSAVFGDDSVLVDCAPVKYEHRTVTKISPVTEAEWAGIQSWFLFFNPPKADLVDRDSYHGELLHEARFKGKVYAQGILLEGEGEDLAYGYNLYQVETNRDRKVADSWSLKYHVRGLMKSLVAQDKLSVKRVLTLLEGAEGKFFEGDSSGADDSFNKLVVEQFEAQHNEGGLEAIPVSTTTEGLKAEKHFKAVTTPKAIREIVEKVKGPLDNRLEEKNTLAAEDTVKVYVPRELSEAELDMVDWAIGLVDDCVSFEWEWSIVDFRGPNTLGTHHNDGICQVKLARHILGDRKETIKTLVHELAHEYGLDGSHSHEEAQCEIWARIVLSL